LIEPSADDYIDAWTEDSAGLTELGEPWFLMRPDPTGIARRWFDRVLVWVFWEWQIDFVMGRK